MANVDPRKEYVGNAAPTTLSGDLSAGGLIANLTDPTAYPSGVIGQFELVVNKGGTTEEKILCDTRAASQVNINAAGRGYDGTLPQTHSAGESVQVCWTAVSADRDNWHNSSAVNVHGVNQVVGTSETQTLTGKSMSGANNTFSQIPTTAITGLSPGLLAAVSNGTRYTIGNTFAAVDTSQMTVQFTAPPSGRVLVRVSGVISTSSGFVVTAAVRYYTHNTTNLAPGVRSSASLGAYVQSGSAPSYCCTNAQTASGLTAGATYQWDLAADSGQPTSSIIQFSELCLEVWSF
jgi:hypothetical protein